MTLTEQEQAAGMVEAEGQNPGVEKHLAEVALRVSVKDLEKMTAFYKNVVQLLLLRKNERMAFFKIAGGYAGHTPVLALFARKEGDPKEKGALDHIALSIDLQDYEKERIRLEELGLPVRISQHNWMQWRSLYINDPEGNEVEFVCHDPSLPKNFES